MKTATMYLCNECSTCSRNRPQSLNWGHECWGYTESGKRIAECESHIEGLPFIEELPELEVET